MNLVKSMPDGVEYLTMIPQNDGWSSIIETTYQENASKCSRYRIKFDKNKIDRKKLQRYIDNLSPEYSLVQIDENVYQAWFVYNCDSYRIVVNDRTILFEIIENLRRN